ncbi:MAG: four helix bundle protein [Candidatus Zambryskibacteria bacterium RIFCSPHIGHO2_01_FULL_49_18]|uniref:Four helix bundle protein n=2 Tax=Candidatus Zambryskiibacteriota TaxID=1817925 RepID=A0A1G2T1R6_9BACT|nr:MAG: four helix bundle protein [Candidatus Zambryskibacteria bacterium RIFCSPHIGHO2_01_FULL_49_18]OHB05211.1 MAG: four helix bundle protein [Candidatus Zambryskibacteria bacterium RIFCSPLOWO2_01_FULL_47_14]
MSNAQFSNKYDLEERTAKFGENIIGFCRLVKNDKLAEPILNQLIRAGTSVGANYMEANGASSKKDFQNKIFICKKEIQETKHWLRMVKSFLPDKSEVIDPLSREAQELTLIFQKIGSSLKIGN